MDKHIPIPEGVHLYSGGKFEENGVKYFIKQRKSESPDKPKKYLFALHPGFEYISSLYPVEKKAGIEAYQFDYDKQVYLLDIEPGRVEIQRVEL